MICMGQDTTFGVYIRQLRRGKDLSQPEVAEAVGIAQAYLSALERGVQKNPSRDIVQGLAKLYEVPYSELAALVWANGEDQLTIPADLLAPIRAVMERLGRYVTPGDVTMVAGILEKNARERAELRAQIEALEAEAKEAHAYQVPDGVEHQEEAGGQKTA